MNFDAIDILMADDFHHHLRDGDVLKDVVSHACSSFQRVIAMPNINPPVRNLDDAIAYHERYSKLKLDKLYHDVK